MPDIFMSLAEMGWDNFFSQQSIEKDAHHIIARVIEIQRQYWTLQTETGRRTAQLTGKLRYHSEGQSALPAVGDWVLLSPTPGDGHDIIETVLPRKTLLARKAAGDQIAEQVLCANVDVVCIVNALNQDFNLRRVERYLVMVRESGATPVILLTKMDLCRDTPLRMAEIMELAPEVEVHAINAQAGEGRQALQTYIDAGATLALVGSSGVGKSTIANSLYGEDIQKTQSIRDADGKGKHTTTSRSLIFLPDGGSIIDTPGMRELQLLDNEAGLTDTFSDIEALHGQCKFNDCSHVGEPGCAIQAAVDSGELSASRLDSYHKLQAEQTETQNRFQQMQDRRKRGREIAKFQRARKKHDKKFGSD